MGLIQYTPGEASAYLAVLGREGSPSDLSLRVPTTLLGTLNMTFAVERSADTLKPAWLLSVAVR
jgi:hypothetical protein